MAKSISNKPKQPTDKPKTYKDYSNAFFVSSILNGISAGIDSASAVLQQRREFTMQANNYAYQAQVSDLNAKLANLNIASAYKSGEYEALMQGLRDAQTISETQARRAGSGVKVNSGSSAEIKASQLANAKRNQIAIQQKTTAMANEAKMQKLNYELEANTLRGQAEIYRNMKTPSALLMGGLGFISTVGQYASSWYMHGNGVA